MIHFEHAFKGFIHTTAGSMLVNVFGENKFARIEIQIVCKGNTFDIIEEVGFTAKKHIEICYDQVSRLSSDFNSLINFILFILWITQVIGLGFDHGNSEAKLTLASDDTTYIIFTLLNSIEFEGELKLRFGVFASSINRSFKTPTPTYMGMFAGATKPKPFQRKRPNQSHLPAGKLPSLQTMRTLAIQLQNGSYRPCPAGESRRLEIAMRHIYEGNNSFQITFVRGMANISNQFRRGESLLIINDESIVFKPFGINSNQSIEFSFEDIQDWNSADSELEYSTESSIDIVSKSGDTVTFGVLFIRDVKHSVEYFWNKYQVENGKPVKLGSTHGRPIVTVTTLSGEVPADTVPGNNVKGQVEVVDQDGTMVRPGGKLAVRRSTGMLASKELPLVPPENRAVKKHWHKVVVHQGWLLKKGGVGIGAAKNWIKRYFVLYKTSQGHFLIYYSDFTECPMYTTEKNHRNIVDLAKTTFIRPGSNKAEFSDTPPHSFDIVTTEREWTLCAESQDNVQKWLKLLNRCVDEDVAILPDEELIFKVKPKVDPVGNLPASDYSTSLKISSNGISVCIPDLTTKNSGAKSNFDPSSLTAAVPEKEVFFWVYTDFYKWSLLSQNGKLALLINVFADSSFSRRNEYIFRHKEAVRLATAIEYFIEKFMSVMHLRLELMEDEASINKDSKNVGAVTESKTTFNQDFSAGMSSDQSGFGDSFLDESASTTKPQSVPEIDLLGLDSPVTAYPSSNQAANPFGDDDLFGNQVTSSLSAPVSAAVPVAENLLFDPFGDDLNPFSAPVQPPISQPKVAPPLTIEQMAQLKQYYLGSLAQPASHTNPSLLYDDGILQIAGKLDVRGSQARLLLLYRNIGTLLNDFSVEIVDVAAMTRFDAGMASVPDTLELQGQFQQQVMMELMKPAPTVYGSSGIQLNLSYTESTLGIRRHTLTLPVLLTSFNEPLAVSAPDFITRWGQLLTPDLEAQAVVKLPGALVPSFITNIVLQNCLHFALIPGLPDSSEFVVYGAASLRTGALTATGEKIALGSLVKLEMNVQAGAIRVTLKTVHPAATAALMQTIKAFLS